MACFSPDGKRVATCSSDRTVRVCDSGGEFTRLLLSHCHEDSVSRITFSPDGRLLASSSYDKTVRVWDSETGSEIAVLRGHTAGVLGLAFSPDGRLLASCSVDHTIRLWDVQDWMTTRVIMGHTSDVHDISFSPDGKRIVSGSTDRTVRVWNIARTAAPEIALHYRRQVDCVDFSPDGRHIAIGNYRIVRVLGAEDGRELLALYPRQIAKRFNWAARVAFSADGLRVAVEHADNLGHDDGLCIVWDLDSQECTEVIHQSGDVRAIADGAKRFQYRALARRSEVVIEETATKSPVAWFHPDGVRLICTHPSGSAWAGAVGNYIHFFRLETIGTQRG